MSLHSHVKTNSNLPADATDSHSLSIFCREDIQILSTQGMPPFALNLFGISEPPFLRAISHIVAIISTEQMFRIETGGVVTFMKDESFIVKSYSEPKKGSDPMHPMVLAIHGYHPITTGITGTSPYPAASLGVDDFTVKQTFQIHN